METKASILMNSRSISKALDMSVHTIKKLAKGGSFPAPVRIGNLLYWKRSEVDDFVRKLGSNGAGKGKEESVKPEAQEVKEVKDVKEAKGAKPSSDILEFVKGALASGPRLAAEIYEEGKRFGFEKDALKKASKALGVKAALKGRGRWIWSL